MPEAPYHVALGDSMSIDLYPRLDLEGRGGAPMGAGGEVGAASLLHCNDDALWPEFRGRDLLRMIPGVLRVDMCVDGATIAHAREIQLPTVEARARTGARVVTLTAGGNDLLDGLFDGNGGPSGREALARVTRSAIEGYRDLVARVLEAFPAATVLLTTVYDPTDGTGLLPGLSDVHGALPMELLGEFNRAVRDAAAGHPRARLADVHARFLGHGLTAPPSEGWYWQPSPIEPGARGASEIRRAWLEALERD